MIKRTAREAERIYQRAKSVENDRNTRDDASASSDEFYDDAYNYRTFSGTEDENSGNLSSDDELVTNIDTYGFDLTVRPLDSFDNPYPNRDREDIQSLIYAKKEFRECTSGPNPTKDDRVDSVYFNNQIFFARFLRAYGSCISTAEPSSGKTGAIKCYQALTQSEKHSEIKRYYYVAPDTQISEFTQQITKDFSTEQERAAFSGVKSENYKKVRSAQSTIARKLLKAQGFITMTYSAFAKFIGDKTNEELIEHFSVSAVFIDEVHLIKLTEEKDISGVRVNDKDIFSEGSSYESSVESDDDSTRDSSPKKKKSSSDRKGKLSDDIERNDRLRLQVYKNIWRLSQICPACVMSLLTGTPMTNKTKEFLYMVNLLPNTKQIRTQLSMLIAQTMSEEPEGYAVPYPPPEMWADVNLSVKNPNFEEELEEVIRGRVLYIRAPETGAVETYDENDEDDPNIRHRTVYFDKTIQKTVTTLTMSNFQAKHYLEEYSKVGSGTSLSKEDKDSLYQQCLQACVFVFPSLEYFDWRKTLRSEGKGMPDTIKSVDSKAYTKWKAELENEGIYIKDPYPEDFDKWKENTKRLGLSVNDVLVDTIPLGRVGQNGLRHVMESERIDYVQKPIGTGYYKTKEFEKIDKEFDLKLKDASGEKEIQKLERQREKAKLTKFQKKIKIREYKDWMHEYLADEEFLLESGVKVYDVVDKFFNKPGAMYLSSRFNATTCGVTAEAIKAQGRSRSPHVSVEKFEPLEKEWIDPVTNRLLLDKNVMRYAIISSEVKDQETQGILQLLGHPDNTTGNYLKLVMATPVGTVGLNAKNCWMVGIYEPHYTEEKIFQAIKRGFRPSSHIEIIKQAEKQRDRIERIRKDTNDPEYLPENEIIFPIYTNEYGETEFPVYVNYYIAGIPPDEDFTNYISGSSSDDGSLLENDEEVSYEEGVENVNTKFDKEYTRTIDWLIYASSKAKGVIIARIMRAIKRISVDFQTNIGRNIRKTDVDGAPQSDYTDAHYTAYNTDATLELDTSTYDSYYVDNSLNKIIDKIGNLLVLTGKYEINELVDYFMKEGHSRIEVLSGLRYIVGNEIAIEKNRLGFDTYLQEEGGIVYSTTDKNTIPDRALEYYYANTPLTINKKIEDVSFDYVLESKLDEYIEEINNLQEYEYRYYVSTLPGHYRTKLFEIAVVMDLDARNEAAERGEVFNEEDNELWVSRMIDVFWTLYYVDKENGVIVNQMSNLYSGGTGYAAVTSILVPYKGIRLYNIEEKVWINCNNEQNIYYSEYLSQMIKSALQKDYDKFGILGFMGLIVMPNEIHIHKINSSENGYYGSRGKIASQFKFNELLQMVYDTKLLLDGKVENVDEESHAIKKKLARDIRQVPGMKTISIKLLKSLSIDRLKFYLVTATKLEREKKRRNLLALYLCENLMELDAIFPITGDVEEALEILRSTV